MKVHVIRTKQRTVIQTNTHSGGGQSLREIVKEVTMTHEDWILRWEDSKPISAQDMKLLKEEMLKLAAEAGL